MAIVAEKPFFEKYVPSFVADVTPTVPVRVSICTASIHASSRPALWVESLEYFHSKTCEPLFTGYA